MTGVSQAAPINLHIVSDGSWRAVQATAPMQDPPNQGLLNWTQVGYDDSTWSPARAPYPSPSTPGAVIPGTTGQFIWLGNSSDGVGSPDEIFIRRTFTLSLQPDSLPLIGQALVSVDDDYDLFVNGQLFIQNHDGGFAAQVDFVDYTSALRNGTNVIAIHAVDGGWSNPSDRSFQRVLFDGTIRTQAVPEPSTWFLLASGCLGLLEYRWRRRQRGA